MEETKIEYKLDKLKLKYVGKYLKNLSGTSYIYVQTIFERSLEHKNNDDIEQSEIFFIGTVITIESLLNGINIEKRTFNLFFDTSDYLIMSKANWDIQVGIRVGIMLKVDK